jgi:hypothetical protein
MEMSQGNSCVAILNKKKCHFFSFTKLKSRRAEQILSGGEGEDRERCRRVNM